MYRGFDASFWDKKVRLVCTQLDTVRALIAMFGCVAASDPGATQVL